MGGIITYKPFVRRFVCLLALTALLCLFTAPCQALAAAAPASPASSEPPALSAGDIMLYFLEVVFDVEYDGEDAKNDLRRWEQPIRVQVFGNPTDADMATLKKHIADLNQIDGMPFLQLVTANGNIQFYFVPLNDISKYIDGYVSGNWGFFWCWWNADRQITKAQIAVATDVTSQQQRNHLILEELTQSLGPMQDSRQYSDSIYYVKWTETQQLSALDWEVVRMLYSPKVKAGMNVSEAIAKLQ